MVFAAVWFWGCGPGVHELNEKALTLMEQGNYGEAEGILRRAIKQEPLNSRLHANLAEVLLLTGRLEEALKEELLAARYDKTKGPSARRRLAEIQIQLGENEDAIKTLNPLIKEYPRDARARYLLAQVYLKTGKETEAALVIREALAKNPKDPDLLTCQAVLFLRTGKRNQAFDLLKQVVDRWARSPVGSSANGSSALSALQLLADLYYEDGKFDEAVKDYEICLKAERDPALEMKLGRAYQAAGMSEKAIEYLRRATEGTPSSDAFQELGRAYYERKEWSEAADACTRALWLDPRDTETRNLRALAYAQMGQRGLMLRDFEASLKEDPNQPKVREIINAYRATEQATEASRGSLPGATEDAR
jgi:tetratricopeptide (TPR) repeat protein